jgi:hypothetical protein
MGETDLPSIVRPNGKTYQPRKVIAHRWENDDDWYEGCGVVVLGTHDIDRAHKLATECCEYWFSMPHANNPEVGWFRLGYAGVSTGDPTWLHDDVRGRAGVMFTASEDPPPSSSVDEGNTPDGR